MPSHSKTERKRAVMSRKIKPVKVKRKAKTRGKKRSV